MGNSGRLVVVSNRLPVTLVRSPEGWGTERSTGGLATAMEPLLKQTGGIWIGWSGDSSDAQNPEKQAVMQRWVETEGCITVDLPADVAKLYYEGYANQTLWPLFHHFPTLVHFQPEAWRAYLNANERFCNAVLAHYQPGDLIWVHDYQLMLLPRMLREKAPDAAIGFYLHIPFPSSEVFRILPRRDELLRGLLGADLLAFHTHSYVQHFRNSLLRILGIESRFDEVDVAGRTVRLEGMPIGIAPDSFLELLEQPECREYREQLRHRFAGRRLLVAVDRLDYTKGIPERLRTYRRLLQISPDLLGKVVLLQVAVPSREHVSSYARLRRDVNELVGEINGQFGTPDWTPVVYIRRGMARAQLAALYAAADVAWVTPLRDGMNLVAKEYVACKPKGDGALVLSEFAGAAEEMGEAFSVNPYDEERTAAMLKHVLALPEGERTSRMKALHARVLRTNVYAWGERFLTTLRQAAQQRREREAHQPRPVQAEEVVAAYRQARTRILFLDYDGTLVGYVPRPETASPPPELIDLLERISADTANLVVLISGRRREELEAWFGPLRHLWLVGEYGAMLRPPESEWQPLRSGFASDWKCRVRPILDHYAERAPGSLIEEKEYSLAWHYRMVAPQFGHWLARELTSTLEGMLAETELRAVAGRMVIEVKPAWANKAEIVEYILSNSPPPEFLFAAGDDRTDEDMFARLHERAWTVHVGSGPSGARHATPTAAELQALLDRLVRSTQLAGHG